MEREAWWGARRVGRRGGKLRSHSQRRCTPSFAPSASLSLAPSFSPRFSPFLIEGRWGRASPLAATAHTGFTGTVYPLGSVQRSLFLIPLLTRTLSLSLPPFLFSLLPRSVWKRWKIDVYCGLGRRERKRESDDEAGKEREEESGARRRRRRRRRRRVSDD